MKKKIRNSLCLLLLMVLLSVINFRAFSFNFKYQSFNRDTLNKIHEYVYWFDNDYSNRRAQQLNPKTQLSFNDTLSIDSLKIGIHTLYFDFIDSFKNRSQVIDYCFYRKPDFVDNNKINTVTYWFDDDPTTNYSISINSSSSLFLLDTINVSQLKNGLHKFSICFGDQNFLQSIVLTEYFYKSTYFINYPNKLVEYKFWIDQDTASYQSGWIVTSKTNYHLLSNINISNLSGGIHNFHIQFKDSIGYWSVAVSDTFEYIPNPIAQFQYNVNKGCDSLIVNFTNKSVDANKYEWDFGDGSKSYKKNPTHVFANPGFYKVKLTATDSIYGNYNQYIDTGTIVVIKSPKLSLPSDTGFCQGDYVELKIDSSGLNCKWNDNYKYFNRRFFKSGTYWVTVSDKNNCSSTDTVDIKYFPNPVANAGNDTSICLGDSAILTATGGLEYLWDIGNKTSSVLVKPFTDTSFNIIVSNSFGCTDRDTVLVLVNELPTANAGKDSTICEGTCILLKAIGGNNYQWNIGSKNDTVTVCPIKNTTYSVLVTDNNGCKDEDEIEISVHPKPTVSAIIGPSNVKELDTSNYLVSPVTGSTFNWEIDSGIVLNGQGSNSISVLWGTYIKGKVLVIETDKNGCTSDAQILNVNIKSLGTNITDHLPSLEVFPNPNNGEFIIRYSQENITTIKVSIFDIYGHNIYEVNFKDKKFETLISLEQFCKSIYFIRIDTPNANLIRRVIIQ